jgi:alpha-aminoadipate carrier protein LysW
LVRCPDCDAQIDIDEDEVEEGEILSCPECDVEVEVVQVHPVHLNVISEEEDDEVEDKGGEEKAVGESDAEEEVE